MTAAGNSMTTSKVALILRKSREWGLYEVGVVVAAFLVYFLIRGAVVDREADALRSARDLMRLQEWMRVDWEIQMQSWILDNYRLIKAMNWVYFWGHMPLVVLMAVYLYTRHRHEYYVARNAFLISGAIAVVIYWAYPVAPPRLVPEAGLIDTMAVYDRVSYNAQEASAFVNPYAAVPSLHFGWSLLLAVVVARVGNHPVAWALGVLWPVAMFLAVIMTGNHFVLDTVAGAVVSFAGLWLALWWNRREGRQRPNPLPG